MPDKKIVVIMPADKVEDTLRRTIEAPRLHDSPLELLPGTTAGMGTSLYTPIPSYAAP
jgi:hypothetical protein